MSCINLNVMYNDLIMGRIMSRIIDEKIDRNVIENLHNQYFFEMTDYFLKELNDLYNCIYEFSTISSCSSASTPEIIEETMIYFRIEENNDLDSLDSSYNIDYIGLLDGEKTPSLSCARFVD